MDGTSLGLETDRLVQSALRSCVGAFFEFFSRSVEVNLAHATISGERLPLLLRSFRLLLKDTLLPSISRPQVLARSTAIQGARATMATCLSHLPSHTPHGRQLVFFAIRLRDGATEVTY